MELIAQHVAGSAQRAGKAVRLAQQPRLAIGTAVAEFREMKRNQRQMAEPGLELGDTPVVRPGDAERAVAADQRVGVGEESLRRDDNRYAIRHRRVVGDTDIAVLDDATAFNEWH